MRAKLFCVVLLTLGVVSQVSKSRRLIISSTPMWVANDEGLIECMCV